MNVKAGAIRAVITKLESDKKELDWALEKNKREFARLTEEQTTMKRQRVVLQNLIRGLESGKVQV